MSRSSDLYKMYEEEYGKVLKLSKDNKKLQLELSTLKYEYNYLKKSTNNKIKNAVDKAITPLKDDNDKLKKELKDAYDEITRLKNQIKDDKEQSEFDKDYLIDKLNNQVNKDSTNSSIPTSKEIGKKNNKTGVNTYNHRTTKGGKVGGQYNHKGSTLTKKN